jgi:dTDP-4-dehydrorhamnose 3,5-epimerase
MPTGEPPLLSEKIEGSLVQDPQTVTADGQRVDPTIDGLIITHRPPNVDHRGELIEILRPEWGIHPDPIVGVYQVVLRPGSVRGWVVHKEQDDRIFLSGGVLRWAFYDGREHSPTSGLLNVFTFTERHRVLFVIPRGVLHAVKNIGEREAIMINMPTRPYVHASPDKHRLPMPNDLISFTF